MNMIHKGTIILAAAILLAGSLGFMTGCTPEKELKKDPFFEKWRAMADAARGNSPSTAASPDSATPVVPYAEPPRVTGGRYERNGKADGEKIHVVPEKPLPDMIIGTLKINDVEVATLLRLLARAADQDILISEHVKGKATISVDDMPWDKVFQGILNNNGLSYVWEGDMLRIVTLTDIDREIKLMEARQNRWAREKEFQLKKNSMETRKRMVEPLQTWVYHVKYADVEALRNNLEKFLQTSHVPVETNKGDRAAGQMRAAIIVDKHTNSLVIQAVQSDIDRLKPTLARLDQPVPQIRIEAKIVQATNSAARDLGIQWGGQYKFTDGGVDHYITSGANSTGTTGGDLATPVVPTTGNMVNFPADAVLQGLTLGYVAENLGQHLLSVQLSALETEGKLNILSSPSITTLDGKKAVIESGKEIPYQTTDDGNVKIQYKKAVLSLEVTPYVVDEESRAIKLEIKTSKDEPDFGNTVGGQPTIITRKAETEVVLFDGQVTVIGGLSEKKTTKNEAGVPILKDMPLLGRLFKTTQNGNDLDELLIFITPHILEENLNRAGAGAGGLSSSE
jgi:type IV pilus assembly protein PilQ